LFVVVVVVAIVVVVVEITALLEKNRTVLTKMDTSLIFSFSAPVLEYLLPL
jgi:hypothetical protein